LIIPLGNKTIELCVKVRHDYRNKQMPLRGTGRFGAFEEFKKHNIGPDGTLSPHKKFLCGLGLLLAMFMYAVVAYAVVAYRLSTMKRSLKHGISFV